MATSTLVDVPAHAHDRSSGGRHRVLGAVIAGIGALLAVVSALTHFYVAPTLAVVPLDQNSVTSLEAKGATVFDAATLAPITTDLSIKARTVGDVKASQDSKTPDNTAVWVNTTTITSSDGVVRSQSVKRVAFDRKTAVAVNCCDNFNESVQGKREPVTRTGLQYKFPFNTEKKTYQVWDDTAGAAFATSYAGSTKVDGMTAYLFKNEVPATVVGTQDVPASVMGGEGNENVTADSYYQNSTTYYVEPVTGAILNQVSDTKNWFSYDGHDLVTTQAHIEYTPQQVTDMVNKLGSQPKMLALTEGFLPWVGVFLGLLMVVVGGGLGRRQTA